MSNHTGVGDEVSEEGDVLIYPNPPGPGARDINYPSTTKLQARVAQLKQRVSDTSSEEEAEGNQALDDAEGD